ncbi:hypothetical protein CDAR_582631 [Caerostris darwini]|uniref:Maturase K n=1 Tax=Caerostris darwini TaxID=1538125 RepID=A0AAV4PN06_9ARAC|nr:hypothetical protein CDAR_582631 [Caerostris darwini]
MLFFVSEFLFNFFGYDHLRILKQLSCKTVPPHMSDFAKQYSTAIFLYKRNIIYHFCTDWPPRSPIIKPWDLEFYSYFKHLVYSILMLYLSGKLQKNMSDMLSSSSYLGNILRHKLY